MVKTNKNKIFFAKTRSKKMSKESSFLVSSTGSSKTQETENKIDSPKGNPLLISISITLMDVISNNHLKEHYKHKFSATESPVAGHWIAICAARRTLAIRL